MFGQTSLGHFFSLWIRYGTTLIFDSSGTSVASVNGEMQLIMSLE
jgi:hypothetical protein